ncbi:MAG: acyl carrier protein [Clostridia bacterium]|nr:acyl carrier protein [Clostridia bacterium]
MIFDKVKALIAEQLDVDASTITRETDIMKDLGADSLDVVEMLMTVEEEWGLIVTDEDVPGLKTVGNVVDYIEKNTK